MLFRFRFIVAALAAAGLVWAAPALAGMGQPSEWQLGLPAIRIADHGHPDVVPRFPLYIITAITVFVLILLVIVVVRFNSRANPVPSRTTHNTFLELAWTVLPVVILVVIAVPSFRLLSDQLNLPPADVTVKATGKQWYWTYTYPDNGSSSSTR